LGELTGRAEDGIRAGKLVTQELLEPELSQQKLGLVVLTLIV